MKTDVKKLKQLRELTGSPLISCQKALAECDNNIERAADWLTIRNLRGIEDKRGREATHGVIATYTHSGDTVGAMLEINCETDFASRSEPFHTFVRDMCLQIAAMNPKYVSKEDVPQHIIDNQKYLLLMKAKVEGKPEKLQDKIVAGGMDKWFRENCLLDQPFVKSETSVPCRELLNTLATRLGEKIVIKRFVRYELNDA